MVNKQQKYIELSELRKAYITVKTFLETESLEKVKSLNTKIVNDLGLYGDDNYELIEKFVDKFNLNYKDFNYDMHFYSEGELFGSTVALINLVSLVIWIPFKVVEFLTFRKIKIGNYRIVKPKRKVLDLTFRDMLTWYIEGRYLLGSEIQYEIK